MRIFQLTTATLRIYYPIQWMDITKFPLEEIANLDMQFQRQHSHKHLDGFVKSII